MKTGRNDPCPCGSGKKYKKCCIDKDNIIQFPQRNKSQSTNNHNIITQEMLQSTGFSSTEEMGSAMEEYRQFCESSTDGDHVPSFMDFMDRGNPASDFLGQIKDKLSSGEYTSIDEANIVLTELTNKQNNEPKEDFLGLSSHQMQRILEYDFPANENIVRINLNITSKDVIDTKIVSMSLFFLQMLLDNSGSLALTARENLQRKYCDTFLHFIIPGMPEDYGVSSEDDVPDLTSLRILLNGTGYIETLKTRIKLTKKGSQLMEQRDLSAFYLDILDYYIEKYEWLDLFRFSDRCSIVQDSALFSLYILHRKAKQFISQDNLYNYFHKAFPFISDIPVLTSGLNIMPKVYEFLFLTLLCQYFGLVDIKSDKNDASKFMYKTSKLFGKLFDWV